MNFYDVFEADKDDDSWSVGGYTVRNPFVKKEPPTKDMPADTISSSDLLSTGTGRPPGDWKHLLSQLTAVIEKNKPHKTHQEAENEAMKFIASEHEKGVDNPKQMIADLQELLGDPPDEHQAYVGKEQSSSDREQRFKNNVVIVADKINRSLPKVNPQESQKIAEKFLSAQIAAGANNRNLVIKALDNLINSFRHKAITVDQYLNSSGDLEDLGDVYQIDDADDLPADLKSQFDYIQQGAKEARAPLPPGVVRMQDSTPTSFGIKKINNAHALEYFRRGFYTGQVILSRLITNYIESKNPAVIETIPVIDGIDPVARLRKRAEVIAGQYVDSPKMRIPGTYEHFTVHGQHVFFPNDTVMKELVNRTILLTRKQMGLDESVVTEAVNSHDKLVATVANYMYVKYPEIFTQHGDGYVMTVVDDVVSKWEQQKEPMQDIKAYALEVMDALGVDRTDENRAQIKTDYKGHHLVNADGEEVQSYPKDAQGLKKARNTLYINHKGLNTMKQEGLNEAFEAALEKLSLNESVTINTTTSSEGQDTVTVTATDEDAYELVALLKAAGLPHKADEVQSQIVATTPCGQTLEMPVEEEYANEPTDDVMNGDMDHMNTQSGGLNRQKQQYRPAARGDNPMAVNEENLLRGLWDLYKEAK